MTTREELYQIANLATDLLHVINDITTEQFSRGDDFPQRVALHEALFRAGFISHGPDGRCWPDDRHLLDGVPEGFRTGIIIP